MSWEGWVSVIALIIAIFALIVIIVVIFLYRNQNTTAAAATKNWIVTQGDNATTATTSTWVAAPNGLWVMRVGPTAASYTLNVAAYEGISVGVNATSTTIFMIDNTMGAIPVTVVPPATGTIDGKANNTSTAVNSVLPGTSATYYWTSTTSLRRIY